MAEAPILIPCNSANRSHGLPALHLPAQALFFPCRHSTISRVPSWCLYVACLLGEKLCFTSLSLVLRRDFFFVSFLSLFCLLAQLPKPAQLQEQACLTSPDLCLLSAAATNLPLLIFPFTPNGIDSWLSELKLFSQIALLKTTKRNRYKKNTPSAHFMLVMLSSYPKITRMTVADR